MTATSLPGGSADVVVNCLAIGHVPDLGPAYREADRLLRSGGRFVLIGYHPYFLLAGIPTHFKSAKGEPIAIRNSIHLISDHVDAGVADSVYATAAAHRDRTSPLMLPASELPANSSAHRSRSRIASACGSSNFVSSSIEQPSARDAVGMRRAVIVAGSHN